MKKLILPIIVSIMFFGVKVNAISATTSISESPSSTEKGNYVVLKETITDSVADGVTLSYSYNTGYLQLVGFIPGSASCTFDGSNSISCSGAISSNSVLFYPVFKITNTFTGNVTINTRYTDISANATTSTVTTIKKVDAVISVTSITVDSYEETMTVDSTLQLNPTISPSDATDKTLSYASSDTKVATISDSGLITALSEGTTVITISNGIVKCSITINVKNEDVPIEKITSVSSLELTVGEDASLEIEVTPEDTTEDLSLITYSSSDEDVARIDTDGRVVALNAGTATITITIGDEKTTTEVTVVEKETKKQSSFVPCLISVIVTIVVIFIFSFIKKLINRRKELNSDDDNDDEQLNSYI